MSIKVITVDLDGVYFPNGKANFINTLGRLGVNEDEAKRVFLKSNKMNLEYKVGKISDEEFWTWAVSEWKLNDSWNEIVKSMIDGYDVDNRVVEVVKRLKVNGYKTAICSSNFPARINGLHQKFGFLNDFDIITLSYKTGHNKPDKEIFQDLIDQSQMSPEEIVFADDNLNSVSSSKSLGITTFLYENFDKYLEQLRSVGVEL